MLDLVNGDCSGWEGPIKEAEMPVVLLIRCRQIQINSEEETNDVVLNDSSKHCIEALKHNSISSPHPVDQRFDEIG